MIKSNRVQFSIFFILISIGAWFIFDMAVPAFHVFAAQYSKWPEVLILIGGVIFVLGILLGSPDMFVPAVVIAGVGKILSYQETHGGLTTWSYMWTLLIGFVGVGLIFSGLFGEETSQDVKHGFLLIGVSAILFIAFSAFFGGWNILHALGW